MLSRKTKWASTLALGFLLPFFAAGTALAHCDSMDGPVVLDAREALETGNINLVLVWVGKNTEAEIREAFDKTLEVRKLGPRARELADRYFFETLVRVHRAGEGVAYTGLKPAGTIIDPGLVAADEAIEKGTTAELTKHLDEASHAGINERFKRVQKLKNYDKNNVQAGREFVESYVTFIHYVEGLFQASGTEDAHHTGEAKTESSHHAH